MIDCFSEQLVTVLTVSPLPPNGDSVGNFQKDDEKENKTVDYYD